MSLHFQNTVIKFASRDLSQFDATMFDTKYQDVKIEPSDNYNVFASIPFQKLLSAH